MIIVQLYGGLGNQMFQYAFGTHLASINNAELIFDLSYVQSKLPFKKWTTPMKYELDIFPNINANLNSNIFSSKFMYPFAKLEYILKSKFYKKKYNYLYEESIDFNPIFLDFKDNTYVFGNFQSEKYFLNIRDKIRTDFQFKKITDDVNLNHIQKIQNCNSVSIHIRRGDYVSIQKNASKFIALDIQYYENAIKKINSLISNPIFFIFSDDVDWVKQNLKSEFEMHYISNNNTKTTSYIDMHLMSMCQHNVIANSTFSWWAAWLNANENKIIISPSKWFHHFDVKMDDILPETWLRIN